METNETPILINKFRSAHLAGVEALKNFSKMLIRRRFLSRAKSALEALYGNKAPIVLKYSDALSTRRDITEDDYSALFVEFEHILNYLEFLSGQEKCLI